jgi:large subunit ribosomal protein L35Ae
VLLRVEGLHTKEDAEFYLGKRVAFITRAKGGLKKGPHSYQGRKVIWGKVTRKHGSSGALKAKFKTNLPPTAIGRPVRVFLYPSNI